MDPNSATGDDRHWPGQLRFWTHDLLNTAGGIRELICLLDRHGGDQEVRDMLTTATNRLIEELRALHAIVHSGPEEYLPRFRETTVANILSSVNASCAGFAELTGRHLRIATAPAEILVTDAGLLHRALVNLVRNALEAIPPGSTATLSVTAEAAAIRFAVQNPGLAPPGLDPSRPAESTKGDGHGLGLHGVNTVVRSYLDGELLLTSDHAHGTILTIVLPRQLRLHEGIRQICVPCLIG